MDFDTVLNQYEQAKAAREAQKREVEAQKENKRQEELQFIVSEFERLDVHAYVLEQERQMKVQGFWVRTSKDVMRDRVNVSIEFVPVRGAEPEKAEYGTGYGNVAGLLFQGFRDVMNVSSRGFGSRQGGDDRWPWGFGEEKIRSRFAEFVTAALEDANRED
ncbi:hypothetical protein PQR36_24970 [Paraburkholderia nemoris]|uniref:hypothetical protein n=1 Tax=Paraburkholderia nemoris TaxID=2793076 RepID=UPI0038BD604E